MDNALTVTLIFKFKQFKTNILDDILRQFPFDIFCSLFNSKQYQIQSNVSEEVFHSLCHYFSSRQIPIINSDNIGQYIQLNSEFNIQCIAELIESTKQSLDKHLLNISYLETQSNINNNEIEREISLELDTYIEKYHTELFRLPIQTLYNIFNHPNRVFTKHDLLYQLIIQYSQQNQDKNIFILINTIDWLQLSPEKKKEIISSKDLHFDFFPTNFCNISDIEYNDLKRKFFKIVQRFQSSYTNDIISIIDIKDYKEALDYKVEQIKLDNELTAELDDAKMTAEIINFNSAKGQITIPRSVTFQSQNYTFKKIDRKLFNNNVTSIDFPDDSEIEKIEFKIYSINIIKNSVYRSSSLIESLTLPASLCQLEEGWCCELPNLKEIKVSPLNKNFKLIDNKLLIGKAMQDKEDFDILIFATRDIEEANIPNNIRHIQSFCFELCTKLTKVNFSEESQLKTVGIYAFYKSLILDIKLPPLVSTIGTYAFGSTPIQNILLSENVVEIGKYFISGCKNIENLHFSPDSKLKVIGEYSFSSSCILNDIVIPSSVCRIEEGAFSSVNTNSISIPHSVEYIGKSAFCRTTIKNESFCIPLYLATIESSTFNSFLIKEVVIPSSVVNIEEYAFYKCNKLEEIKFSSGSKLQKVGKNAFTETLIKTIEIPPNVVNIKEHTFYNCFQLNEIIFPNESKLQKIEKEAFYCTVIKSISFPASLSELEDDWHKKLNTLNEIKVSPLNKNFKVIDSKLLIGKINQKEKEDFDVLIYAICDIEEANIPNSIKNIKNSCFNSCKKLTKVNFGRESQIETIGNYAFSPTLIKSITIPSSVTVICSYAFSKCLQLEKVEILNDSHLKTIEKCAFEYTQIQSLLIPSSLISIGDGAFNECKKLEHIEIQPNSKLEIIGNSAFSSTLIKSIKIPSSVTLIGESAFSNCSNLEQVEILHDSHLKTIEKYAFQYTKIQSISIPPSLISIGDGAFKECKKLEQIEIQPNSKLETIGDSAFKCCSNLKKVEKLHESHIKNIGSYAFYNTQIESILIPSSVIKIGSFAFYGCRQLEQFIIQPNSILETIQSYAFYCTSVKSISIPSSVTIIGESAFSSCSKLEKVEILPDSHLKTMGRSAFENTQIQNILIPSGLCVIESNTFNNCKNLCKIEFENNSHLHTIRKNAFSNTSINKIIIPSSIEVIEEKAFENCENLQSVKFSSFLNLKKVGGDAFPKTLMKIGWLFGQ